MVQPLCRTVQKFFRKLKTELLYNPAIPLLGIYVEKDGHEFEQVPGVGDGQGNLACCSP